MIRVVIKWVLVSLLKRYHKEMILILLFQLIIKITLLFLKLKLLLHIINRGYFNGLVHKNLLSMLIIMILHWGLLVQIVKKWVLKLLLFIKIQIGIGRFLYNWSIRLVIWINRALSFYILLKIFLYYMICDVLLL